MQVANKGKKNEIENKETEQEFCEMDEKERNVYE